MHSTVSCLGGRAIIRLVPPREGCRLPLNLRAPPGTASWPKLDGDDPPPSLHEHYTRFIATKKHNLSAGTPLAGQLAGQGRERHIVAKVSQAFDQAFGLLAFGSALKVIGAEVLIQGSVLEHVIDCGEDGGGN